MNESSSAGKLVMSLGNERLRQRGSIQYIVAASESETVRERGPGRGACTRLGRPVLLVRGRRRGAPAVRSRGYVDWSSFPPPSDPHVAKNPAVRWRGDPAWTAAHEDERSLTGTGAVFGRGFNGEFLDRKEAEDRESRTLRRWSKMLTVPPLCIRVMISRKYRSTSGSRIWFAPCSRRRTDGCEVQVNTLLSS